MHKIGVQLEEPFVKSATVSLRKKLISIENLQAQILPLNSDVKPLYFSSSDSLISGLDTSEVFFRNIELPTHEKRKIFKLLPFQIESHLPYSIDEAIMGLQLFLDTKAKKSRASIFSVRSQSLETHLEKFRLHSIELTQVSTYSTALSRFFHFFFPSVSESILLHIGEKTSIALYLEGNSILFSHTFPIGFNRATTEENLDQIQKELDRIFAFLEKKIPQSCSTLVLTGDFSKLPSFPDFVEKNLPSSLKMLPLPPLGPYSSSILSSYAIAIGLALEGLIQDGKSLSFCEGPFTTTFMKKKKKKRALAFITAALVFSSTLFVLGNIYLETKKNKLLTGFSFLLPKEKAPITTLDDLEEAIHFLEVKEKKELKNYSIALPLPNVSETLAFLSAHPSLQKDIEITKVDYSLVKYPKVSSPKDLPLGKVSIELSIQNPQNATAFYEKFCQNNPLIQEKKEISWKEKNSSTYVLTFFLKPLKEIAP